jgi:hypothetical protein
LAEQYKQNVEQLVGSIRARRSTVDTLAQRLRTPAILAAFDKWDCKSWCRSVAGDALIRIRLFTEQNFHFIEPMGLLAVARYVFELSVWLHLFKLDPRYGLMYFHQLIDAQQRYWQDEKAQLEREIALLNVFEEREKEAHEKVLNEAKALPADDPGRMECVSAMKSISEGVCIGLFACEIRPV